MSPASSPLIDRIGGHEKLVIFLQHFYADVRTDPVIGPIFKEIIKDWPAHIEKIAGFWSLQMGGPSDYRGGLMARHFPLGLKPEHFDVWLGLWKTNCRTHFDSPEAQEMVQLATVFRQRMESVLTRA